MAFWNNLNYSDPLKIGTTISLPYITEDTLKSIERELDESMLIALGLKMFVAIDNLVRFRKGVAGVKEMDVPWLKSFGAVQDAIENIQGYFEEECFNYYATTLSDGESVNGDGSMLREGNKFWFESLIDADYIFIPDELTYACGSSTLTGIGKFFLSKSGDILTVDGSVEFLFYDRFDWNEGDSLPMPSLNPQLPIRLHKDSDMLLLEEFRGARQFDMKASWSQKVQGTIDYDIFTPNEINVTWTDI